MIIKEYSVIEDRFYFKSEIEDQILVKLYFEKEKDIPDRSDYFNPDKTTTYFIAHPGFSVFLTVYIHITNITTKEEQIIVMSDLKRNESHLFNLLGEAQYSAIKPLINYSYWEIFIDDVAGLKKLPIEIFNQAKTVVDLGCNLGMFGRFISEYGGVKTYVGIDPVLELVNAARNVNIDSNLIQHVYTHAALFTDTEGEEKTFYCARNPVDYPLTSMFEGENNPDFEERKISTVNLPSILKSFSLDTIDFLKVDIEGAETYLLSPINLEVIKEKVKYMVIEVHTEELREKFKEIFSKEGFEIIHQPNIHFVIRNNNLVQTERRRKEEVLVVVACPALGDTLCSTPTIRKLYESYGHKICVQACRSDVFQRNPYIEEVIPYGEDVEGDFKEVFETYNVVAKFNKLMDRGQFRELEVELKLANFEARQLHALGVGLHLYPDELHCDYFPGEEPEIAKQVDKSWVVLHATDNWPNRTWPHEHWQRLAYLIKNHTKLKIALIGQSHKELTFFGDLQKNVVKLEGIDLDLTRDGNDYQGVVDSGEFLDETWHVLNNALALISFDSGPIHIAGTTDSHIITLGASINPFKFAPWRHGSQSYKFHFVGGECKLFCGTNPKYSVKEWGTVNSMPYLPVCQEKFDKHYCQPTPDQVFNKLLDILAE